MVAEKGKESSAQLPRCPVVADGWAFLNDGWVPFAPKCKEDDPPHDSTPHQHEPEIEHLQRVDRQLTVLIGARLVITIARMTKSCDRSVGRFFRTEHPR
jgi:hypothetical protein